MAIRRLTNDSTRRSKTWIPQRRRGLRTTPLQLSKLNVRRLMKRDPADGMAQPSADRLTDTPGVTGLSGASRGVTVMGHTESKTTAPGTGIKTIVDRGQNRSLKTR